MKSSNNTFGKNEQATASDGPQAPSPAAVVEEPLELSLEDTAAQHRRGVKFPKTAKDGYNPYDAAPGALYGRTQLPAEASDQRPRKRTDLRKLSEWIQLQRRVQTLKQQDQCAEPGAGKGPPKK